MRTTDVISNTCRWVATSLVTITIVGAACATTATPSVETSAPRPVPAVASTPYSVQQLALDSKLMKRSMPYRVLLPRGYQQDGADHHSVIYLLHGLTGHYTDWMDRTDLIKLSDKYSFIIVTPEGNDGWYVDSPLKPDDKYESYIINELVPEIDKRFRTIRDREHRVIAGLSMGGYGSIKFGLKYPDKFALVGSFSGALGIPQWSENALGSKLIGKSIDVVFGPLGAESRRQNDVFRAVNDLGPERISSLPYFYLSCGTEDTAMIKLNNDLAALLKQKNIPSEYHTHRGTHSWIFWNEEIQAFLAVADSRIGH